MSTSSAIKDVQMQVIFTRRRSVLLRRSGEGVVTNVSSMSTVDSAEIADRHGR